MKISLHTTNQHKKWNHFHFEHFPQNSKLTLDRSHRDYRALVNKSAARFTFSDAPRAQVNLSKLLTALSTIAALSAGTLTKNVQKFWRVPALGAAMAESALRNFPRGECFLPRSPHVCWPWNCPFNKLTPLWQSLVDLYFTYIS